MMEQFKEIEGYGGDYLIGDCGTVLSTSFRNNIVNKKRRLPIKATSNGNGYMVVSLHKCGERDRRYVHRLVAEAFVKKETGKDYVNHKDGNRANNRADNLEWCTQGENVRYSVDRMQHPKTVSRPTATGHKYITIHNSHGKRKYRVQIRRKGHPTATREFYSVEDAVVYRDGVLNETIKA